MARITTITNQKGGVGKTTTSHSLVTGLQLKGLRVLALDIDPQANLSFTMGANDRTIGIYEALRGEVNTSDTIQKTSQADIIPSSLLLAGADMEFTQTGREYLLRDALKDVKNSYDYIIIDTPPTLGILTINALTASDDILIPMGADIYSLQGLAQLCNTIEKVKRYCNPDLAINGLLITRYNGRTILSKELKENIQQKAIQLQTRAFSTVIREGIAIKEAQTMQTSIYTDGIKSNAAQDYLKFIEEYLDGGKING